MEWENEFILLQSHDIEEVGEGQNYISHQENKGNRTSDKMEKQYHVGSCMEASLSLEEYRNLEFPNLKKVKWTTSAEGDIRQIFFTPDTMITLNIG